MDNVQNTDTPVNDLVPVDAVGSPSEAPDAATSDPESAPSPVDRHENGIKRVARMIVKILDDPSMLRRWARVGEVAYNVAIFQASTVKDYEAKDFKRSCDRIEDEVRMTSHVNAKELRVSLFVRIYLFLEALRPTVPTVDQLSYFLVSHKFVPMMTFSPKSFAEKSKSAVASLKPEWEAVAIELAEIMSGPSKLSVKDLDARIAAHEAKIEADRLSKFSPDQIADRDRKAALAERNQKIEKVRKQLSEGVDDALGGLLRPEELMGIVDEIAKGRKVALPIGDLDKLARMSPAEAKLLAKTLNEACNISAMKVLRDQLDAMVKTFENAAIKSKLA